MPPILHGNLLSNTNIEHFPNNMVHRFHSQLSSLNPLLLNSCFQFIAVSNKLMLNIIRIRLQSLLIQQYITSQSNCIKITDSNNNSYISIVKELKEYLSPFCCFVLFCYFIFFDINCMFYSLSRSLSFFSYRIQYFV